MRHDPDTLARNLRARSSADPVLTCTLHGVLVRWTQDGHPEVEVGDTIPDALHRAVQHSDWLRARMAVEAA